MPENKEKSLIELIKDFKQKTFKAFMKILKTTTQDGHSHTYFPGSKKTSKSNGHTHDVVNGFVKPADGHIHFIIKDKESKDGKKS